MISPWTWVCATLAGVLVAAGIAAAVKEVKRHHTSPAIFEPGSRTAYVAGAHEAEDLCSSHIASRKPWPPTLLALSQKSRLAQKTRIS
jgi:hypothetical protein